MLAQLRFLDCSSIAFEHLLASQSIGDISSRKTVLVVLRLVLGVKRLLAVSQNLCLIYRMQRVHL